MKKNIATNRIGKEVTNLELPKGRISYKSEYGYLMPWNEYYSPKALNAILNKGIRAKVSMKQFKNDGISYDYGTIFIPVQNQKLECYEVIYVLRKSS